MRGVNKLIVVGRVGADPEVQTSKAGKPWCAFSVATHRARRQGDEWVEETDWHKVRVFGTQAETCQRFLRKGSMVGVEGSMSYDRWTDEQGTSRFSARVLADRVSFLADLRPAEAELSA